ncbi:MAG: PHP domain-containing protein [Acidimicrobiales bacterium]|nr:PHP domain-containing protein [Acidimicrobiales bacterium]
MGPAEALDRIAYLLDRMLAPAAKARAFHRARDIAAALGEDQLRELTHTGSLEDVPGIGKSTGAVIREALEGKRPSYLVRLETEAALPLSDQARPWREALRGDCHVHSDWSDGGAPIETMARTAMELGHDYLVITDHSPRLTVAHGLNRDRLLDQLVQIERLNDELAPFRILTGIEVDILDDGQLDLDDDLLARLDIVVASVHSKLHMPAAQMTRRLVTAIASPHTDILGHCTNRKLSSSGEQPRSDAVLRRQPSQFDAEIVFAACAKFDTAVEINCRPERQDPPDGLVALAMEWGCKFAISTDAHAPGQLEWQVYGSEKASRHAIALDQIINTWDADQLVDWARSHASQ